MTQLKSAFKQAIISAAHAEFKKEFQKSFKEQEFILQFPQVTSENFATLDPKKGLNSLAEDVKNIIENLLITYSHKAKANVFISKSVLGPFVEETLNTLTLDDFRQEATEIINETLEVYGVPEAILQSAENLLCTIFVQSMYPRLQEAYQTRKNDSFLAVIDELTEICIKEAFTEMVDLCAQEKYPPFKGELSRQFICELLPLYKRGEDVNRIGNLLKIVVNAKPTQK